MAQLAVDGFLAAGHDDYLVTALNNASNRYSDLAGLEETREGLVQSCGSVDAANGYLDTLVEERDRWGEHFGQVRMRQRNSRAAAGGWATAGETSVAA